MEGLTSGGCACLIETHEVVVEKKAEALWRQLLTPMQYHVLRGHLSVMEWVEMVCATSDGCVFPDGSAPLGSRYGIHSASLTFGSG